MAVSRMEINGSVVITNEYVDGSVVGHTHKWIGGHAIGMSGDFLRDCYDGVVEYDPPAKKGTFVKLGQYLVEIVGYRRGTDVFYAHRIYD
jgi:hypothetical protein